MDPRLAHSLNPALFTQRLVLEPLAGRHADELFQPLQDAALYQWISMTPPASLDTMRARWEWLEGRVSSDGLMAWLNWIIRRRDNGACVGRIDVEVDAAHEVTNLGYVLVHGQWGHGFATEAVSAVVEHLIAQGVARLVATVTVGNEASCRVLEKAGFSIERILPDNDTIRGVKCDDIEYVRTIVNPRALPAP